MAEEKRNVDLSGSLQSASPEPRKPEAAAEGVAEESRSRSVAEAAYEGKSREEVIAMHKEIEKRLGEQGDELGQLRNFIGRVGMFFKVDGDSVTLNDDVLRKYAEVQGWVPKSETDNEKPETPNEGNDVFEQNERSTIQEMIRQEIQSAFKSNFEPLQNQFVQSQHQQWIEKTAQRHPDFMGMRSKVADFINKTGFQVNSAEDLEKAYVATRALSGEMVDKKQTDAHIKELQKTLQNLTPGNRGPIKPEHEMSNAELLGVETADTPEKKAFEALTGKTYYRD